MSESADITWCETCNCNHGPLYICEHYSEARKAELVSRADALRANLRDPAWRARQISNGVPTMALEIMGIFIGGKPE